jgi:signal recognition particle subunit SRP54
MRAVTGKPIKLIGTGEKMDALEDFHPPRIADRILGMGDIVSLVEKAAQNIDAEKAAAMAKRMQKGEFDLNDLSEQLKQMQNLGGMGGIMGMLPGVGKMKKQMDAAGLDDSIFKRQQAIISSMTRQERKSPKILNANRKKRIAAGSGTSVQDINKLLKMHLQMADMMKKMGKGGMKGLMGSLGGMMGGGGGMMGRMLGGGGMPPGMPDLSKMDPKEIERMAREMGIGGPGGMPKLPGGLPGGLPGLPGLGKKK